MRTSLCLLMTALGLQAMAQTGSFLDAQLKNERVRNAQKVSGAILQHKLDSLGLSAGNLRILIVALKAEDALYVYAKSGSGSPYRLLTTYPICSRSGVPGPKREQGDGQVPEGFYHIDRFNPASNFHLSLGINYPNQADRIRSRGLNPGGDIFIHGSCVTIGCIPITDEKIRELYLLSVYARNSGQQRIPVYIFPFRMTDQALKDNLNDHPDHRELEIFWSDLKTGFDLFMENPAELRFSIGSDGRYQFD